MCGSSTTSIQLIESSRERQDPAPLLRHACYYKNIPAMLVEAHVVRFDSISLDGGATLAPVDVAYETYGALNPPEERHYCRRRQHRVRLYGRSWLRSGVQAGYERYGDGAVQFHGGRGRGKPL